MFAVVFKKKILPENKGGFPFHGRLSRTGKPSSWWPSSSRECLLTAGSVFISHY